MATKIFTELLSGNTAVIVFAIAALYYLHREAMSKLDKLTDSIIELASKTAVHESDIKRLRESNHYLVNNMLTEKQVKEFLKHID